MNKKGLYTALSPLVISIVSSFIILFFAYIFGTVYLIGDSRELYPLLEGIIGGLVASITIGTLIYKKKSGFIYSVILSVIFLSIAAYYSSYPYFASTDLTLTLIGFALMIPFVLIFLVFSGNININSRKKWMGLMSASSILIIIIIMMFADLYEVQGQILLPERVEVIGLTSIAVTLIYFLMNK